MGSEIFDRINRIFFFINLVLDGFAPLSQVKRFEKAGMNSEYFSLYNYLCSHSHSNIRSLYDRYANINNDEFTVIIFKEPTSQDIDLYSITLCDLLIEALLIIHKYFNSDLISKIETISTEWEEFKAKLQVNDYVT